MVSLGLTLMLGACADAGNGDVAARDGADALAQEATPEADGDPSATTPPAADEPAWAKREDLGKGNGQDVITIGDSWMAGAINIGGIQGGLDSLGTRYRHYAVTATQLANGQIPSQYTRAKRANPKISTVIMTGGGNDVLIGGNSCATPEACARTGSKITNALDKLWTEMANDGVKDVVYIQYSNSAGSTPAENRGTGNASVPICKTGKIICHSVPTSDIIKRSDLADGIHPNAAGNRRIAERVLKLMEERKVRR